MPEIKIKNMREAEFSSFTTKLFRRNVKFSRSYFRFLLFLIGAFLFAFSFACAPPLDSPDGENRSSESSGAPELDQETILDRINDSRVRKVPEENNSAEPINWSFRRLEPKEITVVEKRINGAQATLILDVKTGTAPESDEPRRLAGQIRTEWVLETGLLLRRWELIKTENISMKYKNLPKPPVQNSNR